MRERAGVLTFRGAPLSRLWRWLYSNRGGTMWVVSIVFAPLSAEAWSGAWWALTLAVAWSIVVTWRIVLGARLVASPRRLTLVSPFWRRRLEWRLIDEIRLTEGWTALGTFARLTVDGRAVQVSWGLRPDERAKLLRSILEYGRPYGLGATVIREADLETSRGVRWPRDHAALAAASADRGAMRRLLPTPDCDICGVVAPAQQLVQLSDEGAPLWCCIDTEACDARAAKRADRELRGMPDP